MKETFNVIVEEGEDGYLIADVVELPGCHTQAKTYDELLKRTKEAISLCLSVKKPQKTNQEVNDELDDIVDFDDVTL